MRVGPTLSPILRTRLKAPVARWSRSIRPTHPRLARDAVPGSSIFRSGIAGSNAIAACPSIGTTTPRSSSSKGGGMAPWAPSSPMGGFAQKPHDFSRGGVFTNEGTGDYRDCSIILGVFSSQNGPDAGPSWSVRDRAPADPAACPGRYAGECVQPSALSRCSFVLCDSAGYFVPPHCWSPAGVCHPGTSAPSPSSDLWPQLFSDVSCIALWISSEKILTRLYSVLHWFHKRLEANVKNPR